MLPNPYRLTNAPQLLAAAFVTLLTLSQAGPCRAAEGIFADFNTSLGAFSCQLYYDQTPTTVANFIALATGDRPWLQVTTGRARSEAFYDGTTFHRVIEGFMIQGGSPNGRGPDGPGFVIVDEFQPELRHDAAGVLSMANSGPDSNGSQFFVTVTNTPHLDDVHTVFGRVVEGLEVVGAINQVETDAEDRPVTPVRLDSVVIRRVGEAAVAFDLTARSLPEVQARPIAIQRLGGMTHLTFAAQAFAQRYVSQSSDLNEWVGIPLRIDLTEPFATSVPVATGGERKFFSLTAVQYPGSTRCPGALAGRALTLSYTSGPLDGTLSLLFDAAGEATYHHGDVSGEVTQYTWEQAVYRGHLWPVVFSDESSPPQTLTLNFRSDTDGTFAGTAYLGGMVPASVQGEFALTTP